MGSGKTTLGKALAQILNFQFVDLDWYIENRYRKTIRDIFSENGEENFVELNKPCCMKPQNLKM